MQPYYEGGGATLYLGDCRAVLPTLPKRSVDLLLTDPPYGKGYHDGGIVAQSQNVQGGHLAGTRWAGVTVAGERDGAALCMALLLALESVPHGGAAYVFSQWRVEAQWSAWLTLGGLTLRNRLVWTKPHWGVGDLATTYGPQHESILFATRGRHVLNSPRRGDVLMESRRGGCVRAGKQHPTEKPIDILRPLILASSQPGETVLDPFAGVGSTGVAALLEGRRAILIEIEERYAETAAKRLEHAAQHQAALPLEVGA